MIKKIVTERYYVEGSTFNVVDWEIYTYPVIEKWTDFNAKVVYDVLSTDFRRLKNSSVFSFFFSEAEKAYHWVVEKVETVNVRSKQYFFITLVATTSIVQTPKLTMYEPDVASVTPINNAFKPTQILSAKDTIVDVTDYAKIRKKFTKQRAKIARKVEGVKRILAVNTAAINSAITFSVDNPKAVYNGQKASSFNHTPENGIRKFMSKKSAILYMKALMENHNSRGKNLINVKVALSQFIVESGLKNTGACAVMPTYCNNFFGIKEWHDAPRIFSKDDDRDKHGRLIHSAFKIFNTPAECVESYAMTIHGARYQRVHSKTTFLSYAIALKEAGYCTANSYAYDLKKVASRDLAFF